MKNQKRKKRPTTLEQAGRLRSEIRSIQKKVTRQRSANKRAAAAEYVIGGSLGATSVLKDEPCQRVVSQIWADTFKIAPAPDADRKTAS